MSRREIAALAYRILALSLFVTVLSALWQFVNSLFASFEQSWVRGFDSQIVWGLSAQLGYFSAVSCMAWFLFSKADYLAGRMAADDHAPPAPSDWDAETVLSVASASIGVYVIVRGLMGILSGAVAVSIGSSTMDDRDRELFLTGVLTVALGGWLIVACRFIARLINRRVSPSNPIRKAAGGG